MGIIQNKIIQSFFSMGKTCNKLVRLSQAFFIYTKLKLLYDRVKPGLKKGKTWCYTKKIVKPASQKCNLRGIFNEDF